MGELLREADPTVDLDQQVRMQDAALTQLVEHGANHQVAFRVVDGDGHEPAHQLAKVAAFERPQRESLEQ